MQRLQGIAVSPGIAIGEALVMDNEGFRIPRRFVARDAVEDELDRLSRAIGASSEEIARNRDTVSRELGKEYGKLVTERVTKNRVKHFRILAKKGAKISTLSRAEQKRWVDRLPNIAADWARRVEAKGLPARLVMKAYMDGIRKRGGKPLRNWDKDL